MTVLFYRPPYLINNFKLDKGDNQMLLNFKLALYEKDQYRYQKGNGTLGG